MLSAISVLLAAAAVGVQFGWEPIKEGGNTYIVQVEPDLFLKGGVVARSYVPPELRDIRQIEIRVGSETLPNQGQTVFKVPDNVVGDSTKPPRLDARPTETAAKRSEPTSEPKNLAEQLAPSELPKNQPAAPLAAAATGTAEPASFQATERPANRGDDSPSAAANATDSTASHDPDKPWLPLFAALGALGVSAAGNVFLGWAHIGTRRRYREVVNQLHETDPPIDIELPGEEKQ
ncbi:MAG TPA: hypothetical protein VG056_05990 [Pirellulales bacterium]|jgi:hypothetical protein|nr:hypothetical protein [Pirellulales bacterium]